MSPHERLQQARINAGFTSASEAARHFDWNENTYRSHENGERGYGRSALKYAAAYKISLAWLLIGDAEEKDLTEHPVTYCDGIIGNKGYIQSIPESQLQKITDGLINVFRLPFIVKNALENQVQHYHVSTLIGGRYDPGDMLLCWGKTKYDPAYYHDGIIFVSERDRGLQIAITDSFMVQPRLEHRFKNRDLSGAYFSPVRIVVKHGQYESRAEAIWNAMDAISDDAD